MDVQVTKKLFIVAIVFLVVAFAVGEQTGTFSFADSDDGLTGFTNKHISGDERFLTEDSGTPFYLYYTTPTTMNVGEKIYYKSQVYELSSSANEKKLFTALKSGEYCTIQQKVYEASTNKFLSEGSEHSNFAFKQSGAAGNYYELTTTLWASTYTAGTFYVKVFYTCGFAITPTEILLDQSKIFTFVDPVITAPIDEQAESKCELKDTKICVDGQLTVKDYSYINNACVLKTTTKDDINCFNIFMSDKCKSQGLEYDSAIKDCKVVETVVDFQEAEQIEQAKQPVIPINCGQYVEGTKQCFGNTEAQCIDGQWAIQKNENCKGSFLSENLGLVGISGILIILMLLIVIVAYTNKK